jgi:hypothetical protein
VKIYIGYDEREEAAAEVARKSLAHVTDDQLEPEFLCRSKLIAQGLLWRQTDERGGQDYDLISNRFHSTRFNYSRFLTPILSQQGYALFVDCDVVFLRDPRLMTLEVEARRAVSVVQHKEGVIGNWKMVNQRQRPYSRKLWSSVMLFNCDHPANRRLRVRDVNERTADELHGFYWLADDEIGALGDHWNWLVDIQERPLTPGIAHMTLGGPWLDGWLGGSFDSEWKAAAAR